MLQILDFTRNFIGTITDYTDLQIEESLENGDKQISFTYLGKTPILPEYYVQTEDARYTIKEASPDEESGDYRGQLDLEDLQRVPFKQFTSTGQTLTLAAQAALRDTGWTVRTSIQTIRNVQRFKVLPLDVLYAIRDAWMCEIRFDNLNKIVYFEDTFGTDRGVYFMRGLNLRRATSTTDSYDYVTRIIPYGAEGLTISAVNQGIPYVENYQYSTKILTLIWEDTSYDDAQALKDDAIKKLEDLSKPKTSYDCDIFNLAKMSTEYDILDFGLGDTIHLVDSLTGVDDRQRIVKITRHPDDPERDACELSNTVLTFEEIQSRMSAAADAWEDISNADGTVNGVYVHGIEADGIVGIETVITENATVQGAVANVQVQYAQGDSPTTAPTSGWSTTAPEWDSGKYAWQRTVTTHVSGTSEITAETNITGAKGDDGDAGVSVVATTKYYLLQASDLPAPAKPSTLIPAGWSTTEPTYTPGETAMTLYVCDKTTYSDATYEYSDVSVSSTYAAVIQLAENDWKYYHYYTVNGNLWSFEAHLYHAGIEVTQDVSADNFLWYKKTQAGKTLLGSGRTITVDVTGFELGGAVVGVYTDEFSTVTLTGETVVFDSGNVLALTAVSAEIEAEQDLHGYDSAWGPGGGKNKLGLPTFAELSACGKTNGYYNYSVPVKASTGYYLNTTYLDGYTGGGLLVLVASSKTNSSWKAIAHTSQGIVNGTITSDANGYIWLNVYESVTESKWNELVANVQTMLSEGSSAGTYEPYTNICPITGATEVNLVHSPTTSAQDGTTYTISLASAGTVYGGTLNVTAGTLTVNKVAQVIGESTLSAFSTWYDADTSRNSWGLYINGSDNSWVTQNHLGAKPISADFISDTFKKVGGIYANENIWGATLSFSGENLNYFGVRIPKSILPAVSSHAELTAAAVAYFKANPATFVWEIEPQTYSLTPTQIQMLTGTNRFWADSGDVAVTILQEGS